MTLIEQLKRDEEFVPYAYQDDLGWWTIGYGTLIDQRKGGGIPEDIAALLLKRKADEACAWLSKTLPWTDGLDEARRGALQNMAYNMNHKLLEFKKALAALQASDYAGAAEEMRDSLWAKQTGARAHRLALQVETGVIL